MTFTLHALSAQLYEFADSVLNCCYWWLLVHNFSMQGQWSQSALKSLPQENWGGTKQSQVTPQKRL